MKLPAKIAIPKSMEHPFAKANGSQQLKIR